MCDCACVCVYVLCSVSPLVSIVHLAAHIGVVRVDGRSGHLGPSVIVFEVKQRYLAPDHVEPHEVDQENVMLPGPSVGNRTIQNR